MCVTTQKQGQNFMILTPTRRLDGFMCLLEPQKNDDDGHKVTTTSENFGQKYDNKAVFYVSMYLHTYILTHSMLSIVKITQLPLHNRNSWFLHRYLSTYIIYA